MKAPASLFFQSFVKPFYKENAGALVFMFAMMFFVVSTVDGAGLFAYHYSLVTAMLTSRIVLLLVFFIWFLYMRKCVVFVSDVIYNPQYSFLHIYNNLSKTRLFRLFLFVDALLLMPILLYALFIVYVGCDRHFYLITFVAVLYLLFLCISSSTWHVHVLDSLHKREVFSLQNVTGKLKSSSSYPAILIQYIIDEHKVIWISVKVFTCGVLYLILHHNSSLNYDTIIAFLFFNFGIHANSVLLYNIRRFEETYLPFYRSLPITILRRWLQYLLVYFIVLLPEFITIFLLSPTHLYYTDAVSFFLCAYSLLLLINSISFLTDFSTKEYVIVLLSVFCVQYIVLITAGYIFLYLLFFIAAVFFFKNYYRFELNQQKETVG